MSEIEISELFPTPFAHCPELVGAELLQALLSELNRSPKTTNDKSRELTHTTPADAESNPVFRRVAELAAPALRHFGELLFGEALAWSIKEMWLNSLEHGGRQAIHSHANSFVSGVLYLTPSHPSARTVFYRGLGGRDFTFSNDHPGSSPGPFNSPKWAVPTVSPGDLVLFPSYLLHEVPPNQGERRVTLAFNAVPDRLRSWGYEIQFSKKSV